MEVAPGRRATFLAPLLSLSPGCLAEARDGCCACCPSGRRTFADCLFHCGWTMGESALQAAG